MTTFEMALKTILEPRDWQQRAAHHQGRVGSSVEAHRARRSRGEKHPVHDFLFEYYSFKPSLLLKWSPGIGPHCRDFDGFKELSQSDNGAFFDPATLPMRRVAGLRDTLEILQKTAARPGFYGCHGLHEWAMVYRQSATRHATPLRFSEAEIAAIVEAQPIRCSHYDAFRFFTPEARGFNVLNPNFDVRADFEQPGCIHANMDLYKWATKFYPYVGSDLIADAFELALAAREVDMRAAPYDLRELGYEPIRIETPEGKRDYSSAQRAINDQAAPIRARLIGVLGMIADAFR